MCMVEGAEEMTDWSYWKQMTAPFWGSGIVAILGYILISAMQCVVGTVPNVPSDSRLFETQLSIRGSIPDPLVMAIGIFFMSFFCSVWIMHKKNIGWFDPKYKIYRWFRL